MTSAPSPVFRPGGISYLHIPSTDPSASARFYAHIFGWSVREHALHASFEDGSGHVIGAWVSDRPGVGDAGVLPYVYVENIEAILERVRQAGGDIRKPPYVEGNLLVATFADPGGSVMGVWQRR